MSIDHFIVLLQLLIAHLLVDFVLFPDKSIKKTIKVTFNTPLILHALLAGAMAYILSGLWTNWLIPCVTFLSHAAIDSFTRLRSLQKVSIKVLDQALHLLIIILLWLHYTEQYNILYQSLLALYQDERFWWIALGYVICTWPMAAMMGWLTHQWTDDLQHFSKQEDELVKTSLPMGLKNAGRWIGMLERTLVLTFIIIGETRAIGFLIAAKSIFRFGDLKDVRDRKKTEYILIGTLASFTSAILTGLLIKMALH